MVLSFKFYRLTWTLLQVLVCIFTAAKLAQSDYDYESSIIASTDRRYRGETIVELTTANQLEDSTTDFEDINFMLTKCNLRDRGLSYDRTLHLTVQLRIDRLLDLYDDKEAFAFNGALITTQHNSCLQKLAAMPEWPNNATNLMIHQNQHKNMKPLIIHRNAFDGSGTLQRFAQPYFNIIARDGLIIETFQGKFVSSCQFELGRFPVDVQTCHVEIQSLFPSNLLTIEASNWATRNEAFLSKNFRWYVVANSSTIEEFEDFKVARFSMTFQRRYIYFAVTVAAPNFILNILIVAMFFIPGDSPDRPCYGVTLLLAVLVFNVQVLNNIPRMPSPSIFTYYQLSLIAYAMVAVFYSGAMCCYRNVAFERAHEDSDIVDCWKISRSSLVDFLACVIFLLCFLAINGITLLAIGF